MSLKREGYLYIATGEKYLKEATKSATSLKACSANVHITLITDASFKSPVFDCVEVMDVQSGNGQWKMGILFKVMGLLKSPYQKTFFVDTDTIFCEDCNELFDLLEYYDVLISPALTDDTVITVDTRKLHGYYPYNTGVVVFKKNKRTEKFLNEWLRIYKAKFKIYPHDQAPFMEALLQNHVKLYALKPIYNFRTPFFVSLPALPVKILHGRKGNLEEMQLMLNKNLVHRMWHPRLKKVFLRKKALRTVIAEKSPKSLVQLVRQGRNLLFQ